MRKSTSIIFLFICVLSFYSIIGSSAPFKMFDFESFPQDSTLINKPISCKQISCSIWVRINVTQQRLYLYQGGAITDTFKVSTGNKKHETPNMERHPSGPMYLKYTSKKFPGGNYMGLGNMPYVTFIRGGYAIHGTTPGNFKYLGFKASHGCVRLHPTNAKKIFELIKSVGLENVWISIER